MPPRLSIPPRLPMPPHLNVSDPGIAGVPPDPVPAYLRLHYWWAYDHPTAVWLFERRWLVNLILWFNYHRLSDAALAALASPGPSGQLSGRTLQIACVYGDLTVRLARAAGDYLGTVDVIDALAIQLANLAAKLPPGAPVTLMMRNAEALALPDACYDRALLFFLLHEQPDDVRRETLREALRVVRPGGNIVVVDYARPAIWHPARYLWLPLLQLLEPFAHDLWERELTHWLPGGGAGHAITRTSFFGGLYQLVSIAN
jgi:ubiquinone/menaquinone biosynthesis C-methylase UbiE